MTVKPSAVRPAASSTSKPSRAGVLAEVLGVLFAIVVVFSLINLAVDGSPLLPPLWAIASAACFCAGRLERISRQLGQRDP